MNISLALNTLFLVVVGAGFLAVPGKFFPTVDALGRAMVQALGIGDLGIAAVSGAVLATRGAPGIAALAGLVVFHVGLTVVLALNRKTEFFKLPVLVIHGGFGAAFVWGALSTMSA